MPLSYRPNKNVFKGRLGVITAVASNEAYQRPEERQKIIMGFEILNDYNGDNYVAYKNDRLKIIILAFRGTASKADIYTDGKLAIGLLHRTDRFKMSKDIYESLEKKFGYNIITTGHSLGGALSSEIKKSKGNTSYAYNPGETPLRKSKGHKIRTKHDLVSKFGKNYSETIEGDKNYLKTHKMEQFLPASALL